MRLHLVLRCSLIFCEVNKIERSKFNVGKDVEKRSYNGIIFDSAMEMKYYRDVVLPGVESGEITDYELQKKYILQEGFEHNGKKILPIMYIADFYIKYADGHEIVIDIKGVQIQPQKLSVSYFGIGITISTISGLLM